MSFKLKPNLATTDSTEATFDILVEHIGELLEQGRDAEAITLIDAHPDHAEELHEMLPAMRALASIDMFPGESLDSDKSSHRELGDFRILREIGRGGMGVVYEAEQTSLGRRVALKVLPLAATLSEQQLNRFKLEARAAATLKHPHIVGVYSVGVERGVHYYAMELIEGQSLADVIVAMRGRDTGYGGQGVAPAPPADEIPQTERANSHQDKCPHSPPTGTTGPTPRPPSPVPRPPQAMLETVAALSTVRDTDTPRYYREVARLVADVADALDYAHNQGVVHRDIKPANLLLDGAGNISITDFGLARLEADAGVTLTGDILGTLRYMSPEQAAGKPGLVDYRTDIHALGATLYEFLALRPAFESEDRAELLRRVAEDPPQALSRLDPRIPTDLETIAAKALEKEPADRYDSAGALAADLRAFIVNRPIQAKPPSLTTRAQKWARRHMALVAAALIVLLLGLLGVSVGAAMLGAANRRAVAERNEAQANLLLAAEAIDSLLAEMGRIAEQQGQLVEAEHFLSEADRFYQQLIDKSNDPEVLRRAARAYNSIAQLERALGRHEQSIERHRQAIALLDRLSDADWLRPEVEIPRATAYNGIGWAYSLLLYPHEAEKYFNLAREIWLRLLKIDPNNPVYIDGLCGPLNNLAAVYMNTQRLAQAKVSYEQIVDLMEHLPEVSRCTAERLNELAGTKCNLGTLAVEQDRLAEAKPLFETAVATQEHVTILAPKVAQYQRDLFVFRWNLIDLFIRQRQYLQAGAAAEDLADQCDADWLRPHYEIANLLLRCAAGATQPAEVNGAAVPAGVAGRWRERARRLVVAAEPNSETPLDELGYFAWFLTMCTDETFRDPQRALSLANRGMAEAPDRRFLVRVRGIALYRLGEYQTAIATLEPAINSGGLEAIDALFVAMSYARQGDVDQARSWYQRAVDWQRGQQQRQPSAYDFLANARREVFAEANETLPFADEIADFTETTDDTQANSP